MKLERSQKDQRVSKLDGPQEIEDGQVEAALRSFRASVHQWSEQEFVRPRKAAVKPQGWVFWMVRHPGLGLTLASVLAISGVSASVGEYLHHQHQVMEQKAHDEFLKKLQGEKQLAAINNISDEELLKHVDSDISQETPDAMEPLASLMSDSSTR